LDAVMDVEEQIRTMTDSANDRISGKVDEAKGAVKSTVGDATGNERLKSEGEADTLVGKIKGGVADVKDKFADVVDNATSDKNKTS